MILVGRGILWSLDGMPQEILKIPWGIHCMYLYTLCIVDTLYNVHYTLYITVYVVHYIVHCTLYFVIGQSTMEGIQY